MTRVVLLLSCKIVYYHVTNLVDLALNMERYDSSSGILCTNDSSTELRYGGIQLGRVLCMCAQESLFCIVEMTGKVLADHSFYVY